MKFALILCTYKQPKIKYFLESLKKQTYKNYELIVVDQNKDDNVLKVIKKYKKYLTKVKYFKVNFLGLSRARNYGLKKISKDVDVLVFPDDDCEYPNNLLDKVKKEFELHKNIDGITGVSIDKKTKNISSGRFLDKPTYLNYYTAPLGGISFTIFIKNNNNIIFDERLGVGSGTDFGSGEELDLLYRLIKKKYSLFFLPNITVYHPQKQRNDESIKKYAMGFGAVMKKNFNINLGYLLRLIELMLIRPIGGIIISILKLKFNETKIYTLILYYRWKGFIVFNS